MKSDTSGLFTRIKSNPVLAALVLVLIASFGLAIWIFFQIVNATERDQQYLQITSELRASSYRLTSLSRDAIGGDEESFNELQKVVSSMDSNWQQIKGTDQQTRVVLAEQIAAFDGVWNRVQKSAQVITENKATIVFLHDVAATLNESLPELQAEHNNIVEILLENEAPADQVSVAQMQSWRAERIGRNVDKMLRGGSDPGRSADQFRLDASLFGKVLDGMKTGDVTMSISRVTDQDAIQSLEEITELFEFVSGSVKEIFDASPALFRAGQATDNILDDTPQLLESLTSLSDQIANLPASRTANNQSLIAVLVVAGLALLLIFWQLNQATKRNLRETAETNERNQNAILRLLDELADLADGDLTTTATVTEDFTGAIADSINYTIDQLRVLVSRINETSERVASASSDTQQTALHLAEASEHQAQEIAGASAAVNEMAVTIDQVSANAAESAGVAERSVSIANNGAKVVQNTIHGMDTIREQIQDTSKRIKRLGESSQEIGDIVSLINDIADQTNILALNAAIQASMAGDAGRGFAVVADEVQRLAERSATATKQIEALVKTIQNDTNEAVISMEQTTAEVVRGARLAQDAGVALEEIESVSANLAELIQNISNAARQQASSAGHISNTMNVIQEITSQTSAGTGATAKAIGNLASMAMELRESVSGFKLPEELEMGQDDHFASSDLQMDTLEDEEVMDLSLDDALAADVDYNEDETVIMPSADDVPENSRV
ncbi:methyl-accepting chemotaxis protein [Saccharophagus degradans]|uniref:Methyl-accepting chemotaxis protein n=1 Tax=Saccharophagus degradans TaxID=86304 RepID=A0AAW7X9W0_9GAMM|nr:methyl-accepting chemotaxis protein [Saccharophagus degradans]MBU2985018.1 methyl-accepting chemotaxis protein [Saccharophagus degradans]MDO6423563.1 methyl-accepting chemotaxis protein [Saccharophagus degradans]MDO6607765.1 methyl-accepting chemotaxis protein [Saccharophagus degradans]WGO98930.1 methyl-accepting chemotaxis protein [Saccharophagus degradans]